MNGKYKNHILAVLEFSFSIDKNSFYNPVLLIKQGTVFSVPDSKNAKLDKRILKNSKFDNNKKQYLLMSDIKILEKVTTSLTTILSQNVSEGSVFKSIDDTLIKAPFIQSLYGDNKAKKTRLISVIPNENDDPRIIVVKSVDDFSNFINLKKIMENKPSTIPINLGIKRTTDKLRKSLTNQQLKIILIQFLLGKSFREQEVIAELEKEKRTKGGGYVAKEVIEKYWGMKWKYHNHFMMGYSKKWLDEYISRYDSPDDSKLTILVKNETKSNIQKYISAKFTGGDFISTTGYVSIQLLSSFVLENNSLLNSFNMGIGQVTNMMKNQKEYATTLEFNLNDHDTYPKYTIINTFKESAKIMKDDKYEFFTTNSKFLHAKSYLYNNQLMIGSSNFTYPGSSGGNYELSLVTEEKKPISDYLKWFKGLKGKSSIKSNLLAKIKSNAEMCEPDTIFWKILSKLTPKTSEDDERRITDFISKSKIYDKLYPHQQDAFKYLINKLDDNRIFMLADEVGLGKTPVALTVLEWMNWKHNFKTTVIAPKNVIDNVWKPLHNDSKFGGAWDFKEVSVSEFSKDNSAVISESLFKNRNLLIIDESHFFRKTGSKKINKYREIVLKATENGTRVLLLTATPIFNNFSELLNQFKLGNKSDNMAAISTYLNKLDKSRNPIRDLTNNDELVEWIKSRFLSRSKSYVKTAYENNKKMVLPSIIPKNCESGISIKENEILDIIDNSISGKSAPLIKFMLSKRLEESIDSFKKSLKIILNEQLREANNDLISRVFKIAKSADEIELLGDIDRVDIDKETLSYKVDKKALEIVSNGIKKLSLVNFPKYKNLHKLILKNAEKGIAIFTTSVETTSALYSAIVNDFPNLQIGAVSGKSKFTNSRVNDLIKNENDVVSLFSPEKMHGDIHDAIKMKKIGAVKDYKLDILIMTDKFAEGINLQENKTIINFDFPWSPMVVQQRVGRLYRLNSKYETINVYNLWPSKFVERKVKVWARSIKKHIKSSSIQNLPDIFKQNFESSGISFEDANIDSEISYESIRDIVPIRNEALIADSEIKPGWYTSIEGEKYNLFNLFKIENSYYIISGTENIDSNSVSNMNKLNRLLKGRSKIKREIHDVFLKRNTYDKIYSPILKKHILELKKINDVNNVKVELIATVFIDKKRGDLLDEERGKL